MGWWVWYTKSVPRAEESSKSAPLIAAPQEARDVETNKPTALPLSTLPSASSSPVPVATTVLQQVPFLVQAPGGAWRDQVFQGGCEEASLIMADAWVRAMKTIDAVAGKALIQKMSGYAETTFGARAYDTSATDTVKVAQHFFPNMSIVAETDVSLQTIIDHVLAGQLVITPMDGLLLGNPHFMPPGPEHHMLVAIGYDATTHEFIANDPGTRYGESYRYPEQTFYAAIRDYPTGDHLPVTTIRKDILVISK